MKHHQERILKKFKFLSSKDILISFTGAHSLNRQTIGILEVLLNWIANSQWSFGGEMMQRLIKEEKKRKERQKIIAKQSIKSQQINQRSKENLILKSLRKQQRQRIQITLYISIILFSQGRDTKFFKRFLLIWNIYKNISKILQEQQVLY
ncbi:unnamed protein product [Paramecium primaurelia]|uniref:Uncharacterized protein n=1 Tax=Paramecium primaurelia TaxID=5886 RepID=A0A8S1K4K7_PARPR|nr:unnamed protein product [Paramecium primaurelia]